jgi:hypothetical protein
MTRASKGLWLVALGTVVVAAAVLSAMGRSFWCTCGIVRLWSGDTWGPENSQQLFDPYGLTHVTHGVLLYTLAWWIAPRWSVPARAVPAIAFESTWEIVENTDAVINRYREATLALGYYGDSVINSIGDILLCGVGFALAARLSARASLALVVVLELVLLVWIRDNLALNLVMLAWPIEAIKTWQLGH